MSDHTDARKNKWGTAAFVGALALIVGASGGYIVSETVEAEPEAIATGGEGAAPDTDAGEADDSGGEAVTPTTTHGHDDGGGGGPQLNPTGGEGHHEEWNPEAILDPQVQATLTTEMATVREITAQYPTVADAEAAGFRRVGPFAAGSGAHYIRPDVMSRDGAGGLATFAVDKPIIYLFAGNDPSSPVVGLMYYLFGDEPEGFAGPNDRWHQHTGLCLGYSADAIELPLPVDRDVTREQCDEVNGSFMDTTGWMIHVWSAPGWEAPEGVFAHDNSLLVCTDDTPPEEVTLHEGCQGMSGA
jgi:hypothetical protein